MRLHRPPRDCVPPARPRRIPAVPRANDTAAALLQEMADLMAILGHDGFRVRAYEKAAAAVAAYAKDIESLDIRGLQAIPSIGRSMASRIEEVLQTGTISDLEALRLQIPAGVRDMTRIPGLGPKRAMMLFTEKGIDTVDALIQAAKSGALRGLKGFGAKTEENILKGLEQAGQQADRVLIDVALGTAESLIAGLQDMPEVMQVAYAGSLRRMRETIGDVDLLVASTDAAPIMQRFTSLDDVQRVLAHGDTKSAIIAANGLQVDLRVVHPDAWGAAMIYFTGSKAHNIKIRERAVKAGLKLNEYGLFRLHDDKRIAARTEEEVYAALGMDWVPPPLREDAGEIDAAVNGALPDLIAVEHLRGDLHTHTDMTDGHASLEDMVAAAAARGYAYYAVTDHAGDFMAMQRTTREKMLQQRARIATLQRKYPKMRILHGTELNIQPDGIVDYDPEFLSGYDICVASVHSMFSLSREQQTQRLLRAMDNPNVHVIGHPSGRKVGRRAPIEFDEEAVFAAAAATGTALEINAHPDRLDLRDEHARLARSMGATVSIDSDAHAIGHLAAIRFGVGTAQRGWIERRDVLNARTLKQLEAFIARKRRG